MTVRCLSVATALLFASICSVRAEEGLVAYKSLSPELALDLARAALASCRTRGYQVAVAVVDRFGVTQVMLRDRFAGTHTPTTATGKAWTAATFKTSTTELNAISQPGMMQAGIRNLPGAVVIAGGLRSSKRAAPWSERSACPARRAVTRTKRARDPESMRYATSWTSEKSQDRGQKVLRPFRELGGRLIRRDNQTRRPCPPMCDAYRQD